MKEIKSKVSFLPSLQLNGLLFADDFVGLSDSKQCCSYIIIARSVTKCAVVVFRNEKTFDGEWFCGNSALPHLNYYNFSGVKFTYLLHLSASL